MGQECHELSLPQLLAILSIFLLLLGGWEAGEGETEGKGGLGYSPGRLCPSPQDHLPPAQRVNHSEVWVGDPQTHKIPDTFMLTVLKSNVGFCLTEKNLSMSPHTPPDSGVICT